VAVIADPIRSPRNPEWKQDKQVTCFNLWTSNADWLVSAILWNTSYHRIHSLSHYARWGRRVISRRSLSASVSLTVLLLSQACRLGGLHRASTVPFRSNYFTSALHPADATLQRLVAYLYRLRSFPLISSSRFRDVPTSSPRQTRLNAHSSVAKSYVNKKVLA